MERASFIKKVSIAGLSVFGLIKTSPVLKAVEEIKPVFLFTTSIAGYQYYAGERVEKFYVRNARLELKAEEENPHDINAIEVFYEGFKLGYIPRGENTILANLLRHGKQLFAEVENFNPQKYPWERVICKVYMK
jgi:hypothetical protein